MKDYQGFKNNGNWYKGNLHSHTTVSDGKMTPEQSVEGAWIQFSGALRA